MLIFHEGLPRSGKSYSACVDHIIPALKSGKRVYVCIAGINHQKFADICNMELEDCKRLLTMLKPEDLDAENLPKLWDRFSSGQKVQSDYHGEIDGSLLQDSLLVFDEIQNIYPPGRQNLPDGVMKFIAEHGHYGMDIVIMSQAWSSVHKAWRVRVQRKFVFVKQTAIGRDNSFKTEAWESISPEKFQKISSASRKYDPLYFGLYRSHVDGTQNTANLQDDRINIFKGAAFKFGVPAFALVLFIAVLTLRSFLDNPNAMHKQPAAQVQTKPVEKVAQKEPEKPKEEPKPQKVEKPETPPPIDYFDELVRAGRIRLAGHIKTPTREYAIIEVVDHGGHDSDNFDTDQLKQMGWIVTFTDYGVMISQKGTRHLARSWPRDPWGKISKDQTMALH